LSKVVLILALVVTVVFSGCQKRVPSLTTSSIDPFAAVSLQASSWQIGANFYYGQECISGDVLVGLELNLSSSADTNGLMPSPKIAVYDLRTRQKTRLIDPPEGRMIDSPSIYGNKIVFAAVDSHEYFQAALSSRLGPPPNFDIFLFDLQTDEFRQLTAERHSQMSPRIWGDTVVWLDARNQPRDQYPPPWDVYALDLKTNIETRITSNSTAEGYSQLAISGSLVVWTDMRHADPGALSHASNDSKYNNEIYLYDLATGQERRLTASAENDHSPDIDGNHVVWLRQIDYNKSDVFIYDLGSGQETQISTTGYACSSPSVYRDQVAWADASISNGNVNNDVVINGVLPGADIVLMNLKIGKDVILSPILPGDVWISPIIHGSHVIYQLSRQMGIEVFVQDLETK
jgi:hypothetical protein